MAIVTSTPPPPEIPGYTIIEPIYLGLRTAVYRAIQNTDQRSVVIKVLQLAYPTFGELVQFRNQYTIAKNLDLSGIIRPLSLVRLGNSYALIMEDSGGVSLSQYLQGHSLHLAEVLEITLQLANILHDLHQQQVIHKDIKPANILIHPESKQVKLIDFSIASLLPKETQEIQNPNVLEGTLAYLAPEQTGRMNRGIDYRADYYTLGVTLYQLLSGQLPFNSNDLMELVHCHIAKVPVPVDQVNSAIPSIVGAIISKLMAKNAEDRYQSALGLKHDLQQCLSQWEATGTITEFELGKRDLSDRFIIPEKLYGREPEVNQLLDAFERVSAGNTEMMLVAGFSGIGKTAVVNEVHKPIVRQRGYFIKGKYDQFNRNIPFSAFVQAFRDLMGQLLSESDEQLQTWKNQILDAVGDSGQVLIDVIPELENIIGKQPPATELSGSAAQNRFNLLLPKFVQVFTREAHPLVMFLDDLQWSDSASLNLLKLLTQDTGYLLILGAYRDNEVSPVHPFILTVDEIIKTGAAVNTITLSPLTELNFNRLVADTLNCELSIAQPLAKLVYQKTQGNPFFATQFLKALHDDKLITFDWEIQHWQCDIAKALTLALTDDVVEFMALRLEKLSIETQEMLKLAACIGAEFDLNTLAIVSEKSAGKTAIALWKALQEGLVIPTTKIYKFFTQTDSEQVFNASANPSYRFLHDRVQQAAYSLIPEEQKQTTHYQIGQLLLQKTATEAREERIFELVNQLNYGTSLISKQIEREELAQLNLIACRKARASTAYQAAKEYAQVGLSLLGETAWKQQYEMTLAFHELAAEVAMLCGDYEQMDKLIDTVVKQAHSLLDQVNVYIIKIQANVFQNKPTQAIEIALQILEQFGITFPKAPTPEDIQQAIQEVTELIGNREIEDLVNIPATSDESIMAIIKIANNVNTSAYISGSALFPLIVSLSAKLSIQYGNTSQSSYSYSLYSIILCIFYRDIDAAAKFAKLAIRMMSRFDDKFFKSRILTATEGAVIHRKFHIRETLPPLQEGYSAALEVGDLQYAGMNVHLFCQHSFWCGQPLADLEQDICAYYNSLLQLNQLMVANWCHNHLQPILILLGLEKPQGIVKQESYLSETEFLNNMVSANDLVGLYFFYLYKLIIGNLFNEIELAKSYAIEAKKYLMGGQASPGEVAFYFYDSLINLAGLSQQSDQISEALQQVAEHQIQLKQWAYHAPMNHQHKVDLVAAEKCRVLGQQAEAIELYDQAIAGAKENEFIQEEALANELAAKFYLDWRKDKIAAIYMQEAYYCYAKWGAKAKVNDLEERYAQLLQPILQAANQRLTVLETLSSITTPAYSIHSTSCTHSSGNINQTLDLAALLQISQTFASTIDLDELLQILTRAMLENSGADRCALLLCEDNQWQVRVIADQAQVTLISALLDDNLSVPGKLIRYVKNTATTVVFDNLKTDLPVIGDYLSQHQPKSVLCLPIFNQGSLNAILYLENRSTSGVFTHDRIAVLNFLCTQAAISLENARLYQQSQEYAQELERSQLQMVQSEKMASLGNLVAGIAHEVNNPIGFLNGSINNGRDHVQDLLEHLALYQQHYPNPVLPIQDHAEHIDLEYVCEDLPQLLNSMQGATDRIKSISTSLRTFSRADMEYKVSANLHEGIDSTLLILKYRLKANEHRPAIQVITNYGEIPLIECFPGQLNQVFMNILANAIDMFDEMAQGQSFKELEANPQQITISTALVDNQVQIDFRDNGRGMSDEVQARIFDHLFTTKGVGKGTGLGLAIARQIVVDKHGGSLNVVSEVVQGTEFYICLPILT